jgi:DNA helicase HerA-like ATPase
MMKDSLHEAVKYIVKDKVRIYNINRTPSARGQEKRLLNCERVLSRSGRFDIRIRQFGYVVP